MRQSWKTAGAAVGSIAVMAGLAACGGSAPAKAPASSSSAAVTSSSGSASAASNNPNGLKFSASGAPDLTGQTFNLGLGGPGPQTSDTNVYILAQYLKKWGATVHLTVAPGPSTHLATARGTLQLNDTNLPTGLNAGLVVVGPAQVHVDYLMVGKGITSLSQLKGKKVAVANQQAPDYELLLSALKKEGMSLSAVTINYTNTTQAGLTAVLTNRLDAAFIHSSQWIELQSQHKTSGLHILANGGQLAPWDADSFWFANAAWAKAHPNLVEAVDLAWLHAAKVFNSNESQWVTYAQAYTKNANSSATVRSIYQSLKLINGWPLSEGSFSASVLQKNYAAAQQLKDLKGPGQNPVTQSSELGPWQAAWAAYQAGH